MQEEQEAALAWLKRNHDQMAEKLALLTEATFTISNMLAAGGGANLDAFADAAAEEGEEVKRAGSFAGVGS